VLASGSEARGCGVVQGVDVAGLEKQAKPSTQANGTLNRGAVQDYGLIELPDLEAQAVALLSDMTQSS